MRDIVERLRQPWAPSNLTHPLMTEAADTITVLTAEVERLKEACNHSEVQALGEATENAALRARVKELEEALDKMQRSRDRYRQAWEEEKARAALSPSQPAPQMEEEDEMDDYHGN